MSIFGHLLSDPCGVAEIQHQAKMEMRQYTQSADQSLASSNCQSVTWTQLHLYWTADIQIGDYLRYLLQQFSETVPIPTTSAHIVPFSKMQGFKFSIGNGMFGELCFSSQMYKWFQIFDRQSMKWNHFLTKHAGKEKLPRLVDGSRAMSGYRAGEAEWE